MSEWVRWAFAVLFFAAGFVSIAVSIFGVFRFRFVLNRMQAAAIIDTFGMFFITLGLMLLSWDMNSCVLPGLAHRSPRTWSGVWRFGQRKIFRSIWKSGT